MLPNLKEIKVVKLIKVLWIFTREPLSLHRSGWNKPALTIKIMANLS